MPRTKFQSFIFSLFMVFFMVFIMTCFTLAQKTGGFSYEVFPLAIKEMWLEYVIVFVLIYFVISRLAPKLTFRIFKPGQTNPIFITLSIQCATVCMIVPVITLIVTFIHQGFTSEWFIQWLSTFLYCFPRALCAQIFYAGPLVRVIFRAIFRKQLAEQAQ